MAKLELPAPRWQILLIVYGLLLIAIAASLPLSVAETLQLVGTSQHSPVNVLTWAAVMPYTGPLGLLTQTPFVLLLGQERWAVRLPSILFALANAVLVLSLAKRVRLRRPPVPAILFLLVPTHLQFATEGSPTEEALFFSLLAMWQFTILIERPGWRTAAWYAGWLTLAIYTEPWSILPALGYVVSLLMFANKPQQRQTFWHALPATVVPLLLYLPYLFWSSSEQATTWIFGDDYYPVNSQIFSVMLEHLTGTGSAATALSCLLLAALGIAVWRSFLYSPSLIAKRVALFCLAGGVLTTAFAALVISIATRIRFSAAETVWTAPALVLLAGAAFDWAYQRQRLLAAGTLIVLLGLAVASEVERLQAPRVDLTAATALVRDKLRDGGCVVFIARELTRPIFVQLDPHLATYECRDLGYDRLYLMGHPYLTEREQREAENFFRGLGYEAQGHVVAGRCPIIQMNRAS